MMQVTVVVKGARERNETDFNFYSIMYIWFLPSWDSESCEFYVELVNTLKHSKYWNFMSLYREET